MSKAHLLICHRFSSYLFKYLGAGCNHNLQCVQWESCIQAPSWEKAFDFVIRQHRARNCVCPDGASPRTLSDHSICLLFIM